MVKTVVVEEHHEAFIVWHWAKNQGLIPSRDNYLLHIDEHADMFPPRLRQSLKELSDDFAEVVAFTYRELTVASFIIPAVYQGLINQIYWAKQKHKGVKKKERAELVHSCNSEGKFMAREPYNNVFQGLMSTAKDGKLLKSYLGAEEDMPEQQEVLLDIDLDYFSAIEFPHEYQSRRIEITREEYERFIGDKYHFMRLTGPRCEAREIEGQFYYEINATDEIYPSRLKIDEDLIAARVQELIDSLKAKDIRPQLISVCRSKLSGYTPADQCEFIEELLMNGLSHIYDMDICHVEDILAESTI